LLDLDIQVAADLAKKINMLFGTACVDDYDYCINNFENYTNRELAILTIASHFTKVGKSNIERIRTEVLHKAIFELVPEKTQAPISPREGVFRDFKCN
jgi:predicted DNA-binding helix-hairpin-helix protein